MRLPDLRTTDLKRLSDFVGGMQLCEDMIELETFVQSYLRTLVDGDVTVWNEVTYDGNISYASTWPEFDEQFWNQWAPALVANLHEHPFVQQVTRSRPSLHASRMSDYASYPNFQETTLFNDIYSEWECRHLCISSFDTGKGSQLAFQVNRSRLDFSSRDLEVFQALSVHSSATYKKLQTRERLERALDSCTRGMDPESTFWLSLGSFFYIRNSSKYAHAILSASFPSMSSGFLLPVELKERLAKEEHRWNFSDLKLRDRVTTFEIHDDSRFLRFEFYQTDDQRFRLLGQDLCGNSSDNPTHRINGKIETLTKRELEALHWIREGKTNPEIAILLSIQSKTVEHHISAVFDKLGMKSRAQLISRFAQNAGSPSPNGN